MLGAGHPPGTWPACGPRETATNFVPAANSASELGTWGPPYRWANTSARMRRCKQTTPGSQVKITQTLVAAILSTMQSDTNTQNASDALLTGCLVSAPAWASWLAQLNQLLTTATLVVGLVFGLVRLRRFWREHRRSRRP